MDDLEPEDFDSALASYDLVLVNFYAPWCPHCIQFDPIWRETSRRIEQLDYGDDVLLAKLNCNDNRKFCEESMSVDRFPTIRAYANGGTDMESYEDNLDANAIRSYVERAMKARRRRRRRRSRRRRLRNRRRPCHPARVLPRHHHRRRRRADRRATTPTRTSARRARAASTSTPTTACKCSGTTAGATRA